MNNLDCVVATLQVHREARAWNDTTVAADLLAQLGLDPAGEAKAARPAPSAISDVEVLRLEAAAKQATDKATEARAALTAQIEAANAPAEAAEAEAKARGKAMEDSAVAKAAPADVKRTTDAKIAADTVPPTQPTADAGKVRLGAVARTLPTG